MATSGRGGARLLATKNRGHGPAHDREAETEATTWPSITASFSAAAAARRCKAREWWEAFPYDVDFTDALDERVEEETLERIRHARTHELEQCKSLSLTVFREHSEVGCEDAQHDHRRDVRRLLRKPMFMARS